MLRPSFLSRQMLRADAVERAVCEDIPQSFEVDDPIRAAERATGGEVGDRPVEIP